MKTLLRTAAAAAVILSTHSAAQARTPNSDAITRFCGDRYCPTGANEIKQTTERVKHAGRITHERATAKTRREAEEPSTGSGQIVSHKTGAKARVSPRYAARFQAYVDALEAAGASVYYMGGYRPGQCSAGSQHPCGKALDVCQDSRGHVSGEKDCHLPSPAEMVRIAEANHLHEGAVWCKNPDYGHAQVDKTGSDCPARGVVGNGHGRYLASMTGKIVVASARRHHRHHHRTRYAAR